MRQTGFGMENGKITPFGEREKERFITYLKDPSDYPDKVFFRVKEKNGKKHFSRWWI